MKHVTTSADDVAMRTRIVPFSEAFRFWLKLGFISFGGPAGQIAIMHRELVDRRRWLGEERFLHALNYCMLLPGPEAHQLAIYIGWLMHRAWGGIVAGLFFILPSIFILLILSYIYAAYGNVTMVSGVIEGFKPVVVAIVVEALVKIGRRALKGWVHYAIAAAAFVAIYVVQVPFPFIVLGAAMLGLILVRFLDKQADGSNATQPNTGSEHDGMLPLAIPDKGTPPPHTLPDPTRAVKTGTAGIVLLMIPFVALVIWQGGTGLHVQEYRFFVQAAFVTFGGAYAVLAYVTQAVTTPPYNWITHAQSVDGLALAETTPGPLIMVLQFVGFMAGWNNPISGMGQTGTAVVGALVATYATFLPSFLFIFLGAPYIERLRGNRRLTGALSAITAAVVGVILNLAIVFGLAVIAPQGIAGMINMIAVFLSVLAFVALYRYKIDVLWVVIAGGVVGALLALIGVELNASLVP